MQSTPYSLLDQARNGDRTAAWEVCLLYAELVLRWTTQQGLQKADAEDVAQGVLVQLLDKLARYDREKGKFRHWLRKLVRNSVINFYRNPAQRPTVDLDAAAALAADAPLPDEASERAEAALLIRRWFRVKAPQRFSPTTIAAAFGVAVNGRRAAAVGAELGLSTGAVWCACNRVLTRLRQELEELGD